MSFKIKKIKGALFFFPKKRETSKHLIYRLLFIGGALGLSGIFLFFLAAVIINFSLPSAQELEKFHVPQSTLIYDRSEKLMYSVHGDQNRKYVPIKSISQTLVNATVAIEDDEFFSHYGFDLPALVKVGLYEIFGIGTPRGGSTITQQFVKNAFLTRERTYTRKFKEIILAIKTEFTFDKNRILEMYLNNIPYGGNAYGSELAAKIYFDKNASDLTLAESAVLASLPQAPSYYSPYGNNVYASLKREITENETYTSERELIDAGLRKKGLLGKTVKIGDNEIYLHGRADLVLSRMKTLDFISKEEEEEATKELAKIIFTTYKEKIDAPHFVFYVKRILEEKYGKEMVAQGGLKVYTTLDSNLQKKAKELIAKQAISNKKYFKAENMSLVSIQPQTGQILSMIGSADYWNKEIEGNVNIALALRQPGSSFKPFIFATAFLKGYNPGTVVYDVSTRFGMGTRTPENFDGNFLGPISLRKGLALSRNIPAIKAYYLGGQQKEIIPFVQKLGISSLDPQVEYNWPLALGAGETSLLELVQAYGVFANQGVLKKTTPILKVVSSKGEILEQWNEDENKEEVIDKEVAYMINHVLSDSRTHLGSKLRIPGHQVAAKTGTSNKRLDEKTILPNNAWTIGYSPKIVTGVWAGNAKGEPMKLTASGYNLAAPVWNNFMKYALAKKKYEAFPVPKDIEYTTLSSISGKIPSKLTPKSKLIKEIYWKKFPVTLRDDFYFNLKIDTLSKGKATAYCPKDLIQEKLFINHHPAILGEGIPFFSHWIDGIKKWIEQELKRQENSDNFNPEKYALLAIPPKENCHLHNEFTNKEPPQISITAPQKNGFITSGKIIVEVKVIEGGNNLDRVEFYLNGQKQDTEKKSPYFGKLRLFNGAKSGSVHEIEVKVVDIFGLSETQKIDVIVK